MGWTNSDYSYLHHIAGSCHTPEEAHRVLSESLSSRRMAIREYEHAKREREVKKAKLERKMNGSIDDLERQAIALKIEKINLHAVVEEQDYAFAKHEVEWLQQLLETLETHCNWVQLGVTKEVGYQLAQQEERYHVLVERATLGLLSVGCIDSETWREVKSHPQRELLGSTLHQLIHKAKEGTLLLSERTVYALLTEHTT